MRRTPRDKSKENVQDMTREDEKTWTMMKRMKQKWWAKVRKI